MTKDEIKKALKCCTTMTRDGVGMCNECPYNKRDKYGYILCGNQNIQKDALNLITEQEKEIERLKRNSRRDEYVIAKQEYDIERLKRMRNQIAIDENGNFINFARYSGERTFTRQGYKKFITQQVENNLLNDFADWVIKQNLSNVKEALE